MMLAFILITAAAILLVWLLGEEKEKYTDEVLKGREEYMKHLQEMSRELRAVPIRQPTNKCMRRLK